MGFKRWMEQMRWQGILVDRGNIVLWFEISNPRLEA